MAEDYTVTGIAYGERRKADGQYEPVVEVTYETKTTPPVSGTVTVPASLVTDKAKYVAAVQQAIDNEVTGHKAVLGL